MKIIIQRTKGFEKAFKKLRRRSQEVFIERLGIFIENPDHPLLKVHELKGNLKNHYAFSVSGDLRAIFTKQVDNKQIVIIFTFIDIGTHNQVY